MSHKLQVSVTSNLNKSWERVFQLQLSLTLQVRKEWGINRNVLKRDRHLNQETLNQEIQMGRRRFVEKEREKEH